MPLTKIACDDSHVMFEQEEGANYYYIDEVDVELDKLRATVGQLKRSLHTTARQLRHRAMNDDDRRIARSALELVKEVGDVDSQKIKALTSSLQIALGIIQERLSGTLDEGDQHTVQTCYKALE